MIVKLAVLSVITSIICIIFKDSFKSGVLPLEICFLIFCVGTFLKNGIIHMQRLSEYFDLVKGEREVFSVLLKGALVTLVVKIASDAAKDSGNLLISDAVEITGKLALCALCLPFLESVILACFSFAK